MDSDELAAYIGTHFTPDLQQAELRDPDLITFLALDDNGDIAAYTQLAIGNLPDCALAARAPAELKRIYVDRRWHGQNVAPQLLRLVEQAAVERGRDVLWLAVWEINERAIGFYEKNRFRVIGRQGFPMGNEIHTDHVMAKPLANELQ